ncbi:hypothetical protein MX101_04515 [Streptococcus uberis]|nr:hypothetical protein [Streptococcus uberis]MCK1255344.1 hypothetical protein [Streptococcus uberis]
MSEKYVNDSNFQIAMTEYTSLHEGAVAFSPNGRNIGQVSHFYNNKHGNGEQVYAIVDNLKTPSNQVKEVTVLFRGSTGIDKTFDKNPKVRQDVYNDWVKNDLPMGTNTIISKFSGSPLSADESTGQLKDSSKALNNILKKYPNAKIKAYGHSLGTADMQYALANIKDENDLDRIESAFGYNGPDTYALLDPKQRKTVDYLKSRINIYVDERDPVSKVGRKKTDGSLNSVGLVHYVDSKKLTDGSLIDNFSNQHMGGGYQLHNGQIKIIDTASTTVVNKTIQEMDSFKKDKKKFQKSGKGLSSHEKIFLDAEQATVIASGLVSTAETALEAIKTSAQTAVEEAEELWNTTKDMPFGITELTEAELAEAYAEGGVTYESIVTKTDIHFDKKVAKAEELVTTYTTLKSDIQSGVETMLSKDSELAGDFKAWEA